MQTKQYRLGSHLVAFLDVMGQRDRFRHLQLPKNSAEEASVKEVLRQTAGFVVDLRRVFEQQFQAFEAGSLRMRAHTKDPLRPRFMGFSDSFVISVPLRTNSGGDLVPIVTVFSALSAAAIVMLTSLASKHPLRGGIDVGLATEIGPQEIYGTALERAYVLESETAQYPRIVVGENLLKYINSARAEFEIQSTPVAKSITAILQKLMELLATDADGNKILDYLGPVVVQHAGASGGHREHMVQPAYDFVLSEKKRTSATGDAKLSARYESLRSYFESRLPLWGLPITF